jgi:hypothetical protein
MTIAFFKNKALAEILTHEKFKTVEIKVDFSIKLNRCFFAPGSGWKKTQIQDRGSGMNIPDLIFRTWYQFFGLKTLKLGFGILLILDPGWKKSDPG